MRRLLSLYYSYVLYCNGWCPKHKTENTWYGYICGTCKREEQEQERKKYLKSEEKRLIQINKALTFFGIENVD